VLFSVPSMPDYGKLSKRPLDELIAGARVEVAPYKRDPRDFVLWKPSKPGEPAWASPCGIAAPGRPGWHIECSAMAWKHLGETFDIHGGGIDLVFPHHENEIAQSRCAFHLPVMANFWMHNGFLQVEGAKMAKSEGNFVTIRELLADWPGEVLRLNMLRTHYRQPIDWTMAGILESQKVLDHWYDIVADMPMPTGIDADEEVVGSLCDDLNTPSALTRLHALAGEIRSCASGLHQLELKNKLKASAAFLGVLAFTKDAALANHPHRRVVDADRVRALIDARNAARKAKNFKEADRVRDELKAMGVELEDHKDGNTTWKVSR
jgi:cysteinyl-tRNA synthetase